jgi:hypothetical protein
MQSRFPALIDHDIMVHDSYGISRSFRRGATLEARSRGVSPADIDLINQWCTFENSKGCQPRQNIRDHYSDIRLLNPTLVCFSQAL